MYIMSNKQPGYLSMPFSFLALSYLIGSSCKSSQPEQIYDALRMPHAVFTNGLFILNSFAYYLQVVLIFLTLEAP